MELFCVSRFIQETNKFEKMSLFRTLLVERLRSTSIFSPFKIILIAQELNSVIQVDRSLHRISNGSASRNPVHGIPAESSRSYSNLTGPD